MASNDNLAAVQATSTVVTLKEGETTTYVLTPTAFVGTVLLQKMPGAFSPHPERSTTLKGNETGVLSGPGSYRFRIGNFTSGSVNVVINTPTTTALKITNTVALTQAAYNALGNPDPCTAYLIVG